MNAHGWWWHAATQMPLVPFHVEIQQLPHYGAAVVTVNAIRCEI